MNNKLNILVIGIVCVIAVGLGAYIALRKPQNNQPGLSSPTPRTPETLATQIAAKAPLDAKAIILNRIREDNKPLFRKEKEAITALLASSTLAFPLTSAERTELTRALNR
jgi:hypothetical protein